MEKTPEQIRKIQGEELGIQPLRNFFSETEMQQMDQWCQRCYEYPKDSSAHLFDGSANDWTRHPEETLHSEIEGFFRKKIEPLINPDQRLNLSFRFAFHGNQKPYGIHTDSGYDPNEVIFQQGIIPLDYQPSHSDVHTVILQQKCYHSSAFPKLSSDKELQKHVHGITFNHPQMQEDFSKYWQDTEFRRQQLNGFSIAYPFLWRRGDTVIWSRSHVHGSSDFEVSGTTFKKGLMWISRLLP